MITQWVGIVSHKEVYVWVRKTPGKHSHNIWMNDMNYSSMNARS